MALTTLHTFLSSVARLFHSFANDFVNSWCPMLGSFWSSCITFRCCWQYIKNALAGFLGALGSLSLSLSFGASRFLVFFFAGGESGLMNSHGKKDGGAVLGNASETISDRSSAFQRRNKKKVSCQVNFLPLFRMLVIIGWTQSLFVVVELPTNRLGDLIEKRVNNFLLKENCPGNVTIRVVSSVDKQVEVKPGMRARFVTYHS